MLSRTAGLRLGRQIRPSQLRNTVQRRFDSSTPTKQVPSSSSAGSGPLKGAEDNAFNRERRAVKEHAAATSAWSSLVSGAMVNRTLDSECFSGRSSLVEIKGMAQFSQNHEN
ncbi:MAG: hypothetical protein Q9227_000761 [Pyrenula ochraceoflavens]